MHLNIENKFLKYTVSGVLTFLIDLLILWFMSDVLQINYLLSASVGFGIGITINYFIARNWAFKGTERNLLQGYLYFLVIAIIGLILVNILMYWFVEGLNLDKIISRVIIAGLVGIWNFFLNSIFNFKK